jgi:isopropylmalate/homocitrate/citramalate synthase
MTIGMDETSRTPMEYVEKAYKTIVAAGADKAWFSDTNGVAIPSAQRYLASQIRRIIGPDMPLACHIHNHGGMAVATTLGAIEGGVTEPDCTWNGYGDQAGFACLEEVVCNLEAYYGVQTGMKLEKLTEIAEWVEEACGMETQRHKAYSGKDAYAYMINHWDTPIGMMLAGLSKDEIEKMIADRKQVAEKDPFNPAVLGRKFVFCWGSYGSRQEKVVKAKLETMGLNCTSDDAKKILEAVVAEVDKQVALNKELMAKKKPGYLPDEEFEVLVRSIIRA